MTGTSVGRAAAVVPDPGLVIASAVPGIAQPGAPGTASSVPAFLKRACADTGLLVLERMRALEFLAGRLAIESHAGDHYEDKHGMASFFGFSRLRGGDPYSLVGFVTENKIIVLCIAAKRPAKREPQCPCGLGFRS